MWTSSEILFAVSACVISLAQAVKIRLETDKSTQDVLQTSDNAVLTCTEAAGIVSWKWLDGADGQSLPASAIVEGNKVILRPIGQHGGRYNCTSDNQFDVYTLNVASRNMLNSPESVIGNGTTDTKLECKQLFTKPFPLIWTFPNRTDISMDNYTKGDHRVHIDAVEKGSALHLRSGKRVDAALGDYKCRLNTTGSNLPAEVLADLAALERTVIYEALPDVKFEGATKMKSATKGEPFALKCIVEGHGRDHVKWFKTDEENKNVTVLLDSPLHLLKVCNGTTGADTKYCLENVPYKFSHTIGINNVTSAIENMTVVLHFDEAIDSDRGIYTCTAYNHRGSNNASTTLRVKDKLAALWPFLGIVAEVVVLCTIIFIYEKRRNKQTEDEDENEPMKADVHETRETNVTRRGK